MIPGSGRFPEEGIGYPLQYSWVSLAAQMVNNLPAMRETWVLAQGRSPGEVLFFGTLHSNGYIFPFLLCLLLLFFSQLFARPPRQPFSLFAFLFLGDGLDHCLLYNVTNLRL